MADRALGRYRVFLFEDNDDDEKIALRALRRCSVSLSVEVARDGEEALQLLGLEEGSGGGDGVPDLIVSDLKMPKLNGADVLERARDCARLVDVPFVIFTSSDDEADVRRCMALGASAYCRKPIGFTEFVECVTDVVKKWLPSEEEAPTPSCELESNDEAVATA